MFEYCEHKRVTLKSASYASNPVHSNAVTLVAQSPLGLGFSPNNQIFKSFVLFTQTYIPSPVGTIVPVAERVRGNQDG